MNKTLKYNHLALCLFLVISGKICAAEIGAISSGKGNFTIPENSTITVNNAESAIGINVGNQDQYLLNNNGSIDINVTSTTLSATGINLSGTGQLNLGENSSVVVQAEGSAFGIRATGKNDFTAKSLGLKISSNENETVRGFDLSSNGVVNLTGQNSIEVDNKNHNAVGVYLFSQPGSKSIFNANDLTISKSGTGVFSGINSNVTLSGITNINAYNIGLDAEGVSAVPNIGGVITADQIKIVSESIGVKAQESGKIYIGKGSSVETTSGYGLFANSRVNNNTPQETMIEFNGDENTLNLIKVKDGVAVFANNALATINLKYTNIDITSDIKSSYGLVVQNGAIINANTISIVASDLNTNQSNFSSIYATGNGSKINLEGLTSIDTSKTNQHVAIYNRNLAVINILGDITSTGDKTAIDNDNSTINIYGLNSTFSGDIKNNSNGVISLSNYDPNKPIQGVLFGKLNIGGDFTGTGGILQIDTKLASDNNVNKLDTDFIIIAGDATGSTELKVINAGGSGARTYKGIQIIQTGSSTSNAFFIGNKGYVTAGAYDYGLFLDNNNWYLRSHRNDGGIDTDYPVYTPDVGEYLATETMGNTLFTSRLEDREGASQYQNLGNNKDLGKVWVRASGGHNQFKTMESQWFCCTNLSVKGFSAI